MIPEDAHQSKFIQATPNPPMASMHMKSMRFHVQFSQSDRVP